MKRLYSLFLFAVLASCLEISKHRSSVNKFGTRKSPKELNDLKVRISNPEKTDLNYEFVLKLGILVGDQELECVGTLISKEYIVTSASCFKYHGINARPKDIKVYTENKKTAGEFIVHKTILHSKFDITNFSNNVALLKLMDSKVIIRNDYAKIYNKELRDAEFFEITGYGVDSNDSEPPSFELKSFYALVYPYEDCLDIKVDKNMLCYNVVYGKGACYGDMGGPVVIEDDGILTIVGLSSHFITRGERKACSIEGDLGYFTNLANYISWIKHITDLDQMDFVLLN
ncbi:Salivary plasminogen activator gamma [Smittium culicis]|uniref:Salivary plasminogen activator gamma n=1 Tax=Smittium culicis TaxID=133412 RepID=A0A1R1Y627_9FUNG|nr:Salivary plasminogen activator gamma [Smittium culicis]